MSDFTTKNSNKTQKNADKSDDYLCILCSLFAFLWSIFLLKSLLTRRDHANLVARHALRRANVTQESRLHLDRCTDSCARHGREHGDLQHRLCGLTEPAPVQRT